MTISLTTVIVLSLGVVTIATPEVCDKYCSPGQSCWPSFEEEVDLYTAMNGHLVTAYTADYAEYVLMPNTRVMKLPFVLVFPKTVDEVITAVNFANKYNIRMTIRSSGHDYIGRSTADGSLQINLMNMTDIKFNMSSSRSPDGEVTVESGNSWLRVYNETSKMGRVIVGGSAHTVSMGGYTLGGGHSPIGRKFGLAIDNLLEVKLVIANGSVVIANENGTTVFDADTGHPYHTSNNDLFWALRGGGGSTYGIVVSFTFRLHKDSKMVVLSCSTPVYDANQNDIGRPFLESLGNVLPNLAPEWGGYLMFSNTQMQNSTSGTMNIFLNHFGEWGSPSFNTIQPFLSNCNAKNVSSFLEYESTVYDPLYYRQYIFNTLVQPDGLTPQFYDFMYSLIGDPRLTTDIGCTGAMIGGNMKNTPAPNTSMNPNMRTGLLSLSCGIAWSSALEDRKWELLGQEFSTKLLKYGKGVYYNEPSAYLPDWKTQYWGGNYHRLLAIKDTWDPYNVFTCYHCVGSDEARLPRPTGATSNQTGNGHFEFHPPVIAVG
ncbi:hypothetical protein ACF0H5_019668 [Mactra antiquata]